MLSRLHSTTILVADQEEALGFYVDTLGWQKREDNRMDALTRFLTVAPTGAETSIVLGQPEVYGREAPLVVRPGRGGTGITLLTADLAAAYSALSTKGVTFHGPPATMPWGAKAAWFSDPFGNEYFLVEE